MSSINPIEANKLQEREPYALSIKLTRRVCPYREMLLLPGKIQSHDECFFNKELGLKISVFENDKELIFIFGGAGSAAKELPPDQVPTFAHQQREWARANLQGEKPAPYIEATRVVANLMHRSRFSGKKVIVCGEGFGGSIAEYVGLMLRVDAYCLNSVTLGSGLLSEVPEGFIRDRGRFIHILSSADSSLDCNEDTFRLLFSPSISSHPPYFIHSLIHHLTDSAQMSLLSSERSLHTQLKERMSGISQVVLLLKEIQGSSSDVKAICCDQDILRQKLQQIKAIHEDIYFFICFAVWVSLGKRDCGDFNWGEKRLLENPQLLHEISCLNQKKRFIEDLIACCEFLIAVFRLIPNPAVIPISENTSHITDYMRDVIGLKHFELNKDDVFTFVSNLYIFLTDQLDNFCSNRIARINARLTKKEYQILPKEHLLATRFHAAQSVAKRILIASVECLGILKVGGLAEAVREIAAGLKEQGHQVTLIMPKYEKFPQDLTKTATQSLQKTEMVVEHFFGGLRKDSLLCGKVGDIDAFFVEQEKLANDERDLFELGETGIYKIAGDDKHATRLKERFAYFGSALAGFIYQMRNHFDAVIFNDWHGALAIHLSVSRYFNAWRKGQIPAFIYVFHNNGYAAQGILDDRSKPLFHKLGIHADYLNVTEQSLRFADHCCTVSPSYAVEVQGREGNGLTEQMRETASQGKLTGILNGANPKAFNPETDPALMNWKDPETGTACPLNYGPSSNISQKKQEIQLQLQKWLRVYHPEMIEEFGIDATRKNAVFFVGRFDSSQKGLEKFRLAMHAAKNQGATLIIMGSYSTDDDVLARKILANLKKEAAALKGESWGGALILEDEVNAMGKFNFQQGTVDGVPGIGSLCRAIATYGFVPSKFEPCGLVQFEMWLFGCLVIASRVGGLADTVFSDPENATFNGFTFERQEAWDSKDQDVEIQQTVERALVYWNSLDGDTQQELMSRVIKNARASGWTSLFNPQGISAIAQYERVLETAMLASKKRVELEPI